MDESSWEPARLIPVSGISGADEQERRGVSALMAVLASVREFGRAITLPLGAPAGAIFTFIEVPFTVGDRSVRPDGLIRVSHGKRSWTAIVEVKTGRNNLLASQLDMYLDLAREQGFDALITISNELVMAPGEHPTSLDKKKLKKVALHHLSWSQIHTEAVVERVNRSVNDPDQAWILSELIRYLEHPRSGAVDFDDMGTSWVPVRDGVTHRSILAKDKGVADVVDRFGQLVSFSAMRLSRNLGVNVRPVLTRAELADAGARMQKASNYLVESGILRGSLLVPNAIAPIEVTADVRSGQITCSVSVAASGHAKATTRVSWLTRQLPKAPDGVLLEAWNLWAKSPGPCRSLADVRADPRVLLEDPKKEIRSFTVRLSAPAGTKRGQGRGSFVGSVLELVERFYAEVVQHLKPWTDPAPSVRPSLGVPDDGVNEDSINGELPIRSTLRPVPPAGDSDQAELYESPLAPVSQAGNSEEETSSEHREASDLESIS